MRFDFTEEQREFATQVRRMLDKVAPEESNRALWDDPTGRDPRVWSTLAESGVLAVMVTEEHDGLSGDLNDLALVLEDAGRRVLPDALVEGAVVVPVALRCADAALRERWLPGIADGSVRATAAVGGAQYVPDAHLADVVVLDVEGELRLFEREDLRIEPVRSMDPSRRIFRVIPHSVGASLGVDPAIYERVIAHQDVAVAITLNGIAQALIARTVEYVKIRSQFGRPLGSFQAVKHQLAQAHSRNELARRAAWTASYRVARDRPDAADAAVLARLCAAEAEFESNRVALQLHGGIGFTWEFDLQQWLKRGKVLESSYGSRRTLAERAGRAGLTASTAVAV